MRNREPSYSDMDYLRKRYKFIVAWGKMLKADSTYVARELLLADKEKAPETSIYRRIHENGNSEWVEVTEKTVRILNNYMSGKK